MCFGDTPVNRPGNRWPASWDQEGANRNLLENKFDADYDKPVSSRFDGGKQVKAARPGRQRIMEA